jgi:hypothetical protein
MERENRVPQELTLQGKSTYSNSEGLNMPEVSAEPQVIPIRESLPPEQVQQGMREWISYWQTKDPKGEITPENMAGARAAAEMGIVPPTASPEQPQTHQRPSLRDTAPVQPDITQASEGPTSQDAEAQAALTREMKRESEQEIARARTLAWIIDPEAREQYFNDIYALVDARPHEFWDRAFNMLTDGDREETFMTVMLEGSRGRWGEIVAGSRYTAQRLSEEEVIEAIRAAGRDPDKVKEELAADFFRFQQERQVRKVLHDVNAILYLPSVKAEDLFNSMQQFQSEHGDIAFRMPGVREMMSLYEEALYECMTENDGYLDPEAVLGTVKTRTESTPDGDKTIKSVAPGEIETRVKERFMKMIQRGQVVLRNDDGGESKIKDMKPWEVDRTFTVARGMMVMTQRLMEIATESRLPKGGTQFASGFLQDIVQSYSVHRHLLSKWFITEEAIAAYLFNNEKPSFLKGWNPKELKENYERFQNDPEMLHSLDEVFYLGRINANKAGGFWTWNSWRSIEDPEQRSSLRRFLVNGREKMAKRGATGEGLDEYKNWTGTGFRFEKMREKIEEELEEGHHNGHAIIEAKHLIGKMVEFQGHRLYLTSRHIRERILTSMGIDFKKMTEEQKADLRDRVDVLHDAETAFLANRESFLDQGRTFDSITFSDLEKYFSEVVTEDLKDKDGNIIATKEERIERARELARLVREDFSNNRELYWKEFLERREYTHGYVLWTGDVPVDEYSMAETGPTGALVRRARDNANQAKAAAAESAMLDNLKNMTDPDQLISALFQIWQPIDHYNRAKARQVITDKAEGIIKFYKATWKTNIPIWGLLRERGTSASYARLMYGPHAPAWESSDIRYFINRLEHAKMIDEEQAEKLKKLTGATDAHVVGEGSITITQILAFVFAMLVVEAVGKEAAKVEELG